MKQRVITGIVAGVFFLGFAILGGTWYNLLILLMSLIGLYEFIRMTGVSPFGGTAFIGYIGVLILVFPSILTGLDISLSHIQIIWLLMLLFLTATVTTKNKLTVQTAALMFIGVVYVGIGFYYIAATRQLEDGLFWTFMILVSIWGSDAGAYFVGKTIGKHKLWPVISPNKTIEGAVGGIVIAVIISIGFALLSDGIVGVGNAVLIGLSSAIIGQMGDLVQSAYKRVYGIKDSGSLLPGHGGILDRCDSWIFVFPFVHMLALIPY
ncbi:MULTISPECIES: phosphatidate cytidylyltransferase [unclassified Paenibacillus]|uniref:phosphatidate cytidylyltransferase n=1 Tax=unclassified Paenibacillus TaxID=185978 RepID=UPI000895C08E|nr:MULTISPECIES: phosphatidate cytidylyltransferase [unclassified Paenibacillus]OMC70977.1 phosphatidate cytidylyltransferase [Paenibacillus sp. FSL H7-0326]SDW15432.1 phosphatidate cytidylyltransferase [Paenibacillus sp. PDC88]